MVKNGRKLELLNFNLKVLDGLMLFLGGAERPTTAGGEIPKQGNLYRPGTKES